MFGPGIIIAGGSIIAVALLDKVAEDTGIIWLSVALKLLVPIAALAVSVYFLQSDAILRFLR
ncbi:hypothetical protein BABA_17427 [Neobacillus bataviensis LMG 21833]|uniref:Uncharacterized protein n=1 Tax=Neobacillus bataviensis LMG 21833 TaxID=1117379 RepID=K6D0R0_9BACI|nr:hypothetical protein [Neobacillus bataviensis]EKN66047.1 hypothetical protein BABA_17427 [Neobacillus bataviensis LMG 21833]